MPILIFVFFATLLAGIPVFATSAVSVPGGPGIEPLAAALRRTVAARLAMLHRLAGDVDVVVADLARRFSPAGDRPTASLGRPPHAGQTAPRP